jgi:hypothetical protein
MKRWLIAVAGGLFLATLPYWRYLPFGGVGAAHMDHEPRHGGQLGMTGDHHIEVVRRRGQLEVFVSDAQRRPLAPQSGRVLFDGGHEAALVWEDHRLVAADRPAATVIDVRVVLTEATTLGLGFDFSGD